MYSRTFARDRKCKSTPLVEKNFQTWLSNLMRLREDVAEARCCRPDERGDDAPASRLAMLKGTRAPLLLRPKRSLSAHACIKVRGACACQPLDCSNKSCRERSFNVHSLLQMRENQNHQQMMVVKAALAAPGFCEIREVTQPRIVFEYTKYIALVLVTPWHSKKAGRS